MWEKCIERLYSQSVHEGIILSNVCIMKMSKFVVASL